MFWAVAVLGITQTLSRLLDYLLRQIAVVRQEVRCEIRQILQAHERYLLFLQEPLLKVEPSMSLCNFSSKELRCIVEKRGLLVYSTAPNASCCFIHLANNLAGLSALPESGTCELSSRPPQLCLLFATKVYCSPSQFQLQRWMLHRESFECAGAQIRTIMEST
jgi:hypothetical protein